MARLLLLIPTTSYRVKDFLAAAEKAGVRVTIGSDDDGVLRSFQSCGTLTLDFEALDKNISSIQAFHREHALTSIIAVDEQTSLLAAKASESLGLRHNSFESVQTASNKSLFRHCISSAGLPSPAFKIISPGQEVIALASATDYPCVLKPVSRSASQGVIRADNPTGFRSAYGRIAKLVPGEDIIVEDFLPGQEVSLEGILVNGLLNTLAIFDKPEPLDGPYFEETIYVTPSRHNDEVQGSIHRIVEEAAAAIGLKEGPIHAELRVCPSETFVNEKGPWLIELAARSIGGLCSRSLTFQDGRSLEELLISHALEQPIGNSQREQKASGVMMIPIPEAGILENVDGELEARAVKHINDLEISIRNGQRLIPLPDGNQYLGFIFAKAETPKEVEAALREAHGHLKFEIH